MKTFISHFSAAAHWNVPCMETVLGPEMGVGRSVHITVPSKNKTHASASQTIHSCEQDLPSKALVTTQGGIIVASPELVFLQFAPRLSIHRLILLGLQLCSYPPGDPSAAITTRQKIASLLAKTPGHYGHRKSLRAIKYVENGSASIMESISYMLLTLPNSLGGYGLGGAVFNHEIKLAARGANRLGQNHCYADLYYKSKNLAIEYESFAFHNSPSAQGKDIIRSATLEWQGVDVVRFSTIQLYDKGAFADFAINLARRLGKRVHIRTNKFGKMHEELRSLLPRRQMQENPNSLVGNPVL